MTRTQLLPGFIQKRLPSLASVVDTPLAELIAQVKFFYPDFGWTWYGIAWDGEDIFFGFVDGDEPELGEFSLRELEATRGKLGCAIERDRYFTPQRVEPLYAQALERRHADVSVLREDHGADR